MRVGKLGKGASWLVDTTKGAVEKTGEGLKGAVEKTGEGLKAVGAQASELKNKATSGISDVTSNIGSTIGGANNEEEERVQARTNAQELPPPQPVRRRKGEQDEDSDDEHRRETLYSRLDGQPYLGNDVDAYVARTYLSVLDNKWVK